MLADPAPCTNPVAAALAACDLNQPIQLRRLRRLRKGLHRVSTASDTCPISATRAQIGGLAWTF